MKTENVNLLCFFPSSCLYFQIVDWKYITYILQAFLHVHHYHCLSDAHYFSPRAEIFLNIFLYQNLQEDVLKHRQLDLNVEFLILALRWEPRICLSNKFPGDADTVGQHLETTVLEYFNSYLSRVYSSSPSPFQSSLMRATGISVSKTH